MSANAGLVAEGVVAVNSGASGSVCFFFLLYTHMFLGTSGPGEAKN